MRTSYKVLISGLDSSFLNKDSRSFSATVPALKELREREIPLVLCISKIFEETLKGSELSMTRGGKYFHLTGGSDAGQAVVLLRKLYQECYGPVSLGGVGDGATGILMLEKVDCPILFAKGGEKHHQRPVQRLPHARKVHGMGPGMDRSRKRHARRMGSAP